MTGPSASGGEILQGQLATTAMLVTVLNGIAAGWCVPVTLSRTTPPSADCKVPQTVLSRLVTCR
jgi:hypothetical protein